MDITDETNIRIQHVTPGMYVWSDEEQQFMRVTEYPITTGQGVFVNLSGGQIGPKPLDFLITVAIFN